LHDVTAWQTVQEYNFIAPAAASYDVTAWQTAQEYNCIAAAAASSHNPIDEHWKTQLRVCRRSCISAPVDRLDGAAVCRFSLASTWNTASWRTTTRSSRGVWRILLQLPQTQLSMA